MSDRPTATNGRRGTRPNVLLIVVDSLRYDATFGNWETETPNVDRLAAEGITFDNCFSQGISTAPAMTAMLTGRLPLDYSGHWYLEESQPTFAECFQRHGYDTGAVHSNPYVSARRNFDSGFDSFREDVVTFEPDKGLESAPDKLLRVASRLSRLLSRSPYTPAESVIDEILDFVGDAGRPWFLWTQYMDAHGPYLGGDDFSYRNKFRAEWLWGKAAVRDPDSVTPAEHEELRSNYRRDIEYLDRCIGNVLDHLESVGQLENTVVVFTADHGDEFYEHGRYGHGNLPYDELIHVPLTIRFPDGLDVPTGSEVDALVRSVDILPTVLGAVGIDVGDRHRERLAGRSLLPLVRGSRREEPPLVVTEKRVRGEDTLRIGFRTREWKYMYDGKTDERYLYSLRTDADEAENRVERETDVAARFEERLQDRFTRIEETSKNIDVPTIDVDSGVEERLKALGYRK